MAPGMRSLLSASPSVPKADGLPKKRHCLTRKDGNPPAWVLAFCERRLRPSPLSLLWPPCWSSQHEKDRHAERPASFQIQNLTIPCLGEEPLHFFKQPSRSGRV